MKGGLLGVAVLAITMAVPRAPAQAPPVFRASVESVYVDAFVSRGEQSVLDLKASSFELKDNGVRQAIELVAAESQPVRAVLLFDTSDSLVGERLAALKAGGNAFLDGLVPGDEVALVAFSEEIVWLCPTTADRAAVRRALDALYAAVSLSEEGGRSLVVLFTDGEDNMSILGEKDLLTVVQRSNVLVHTVGWREAGATSGPGLLAEEMVVPNQTFPPLRRIAEATGGRSWWANSPEELRRAFAAIAETMSHRYVLRYEPQGVKRDGWHRIEIKLRGAKGDVRARPGYWAAPPH